jgi:hypothetical protein
MKLTTHVHTEVGSRMGKVLPPPPYTFMSWCLGIGPIKTFTSTTKTQHTHKTIILCFSLCTWQNCSNQNRERINVASNCETIFEFFIPSFSLNFKTCTLTVHHQSIVFRDPEIKSYLEIPFKL